MNGLQTDLISALPEVFVLSMAMIILLTDLFLKPSNRIAIFLLSQITLLGAAFITISTHHSSVSYAFSGMFVDDPFANDLSQYFFVLGLYPFIHHFAWHVPR
jgi:NADH-quinone oxidoreductase subunit N